MDKNKMGQRRLQRIIIKAKGIAVKWEGFTGVTGGLFFWVFE